MRPRPSTSPTRRIITPDQVRTTFRHLRAAIATGTGLTYSGAPQPCRVPLRLTSDPGERVAWVIPDRHDAVGHLRHATASVMAAWCSWVPVEQVLVVVSELVTNALRHGTPPCVVYLQHTRGRVLVAVYDGGPGHLTLRRTARRVRRRRIPAIGLDSGRGLHLVNNLTHSWQVIPLAGGTTVIAYWRATLTSDASTQS